MREELGTDVELVEVLLYGEFSDMGDGVVWEVKVFLGKLLGEPVIQDPEKCAELRWVGKADLSKLDLATHTREDFDKLEWLSSIYDL